MDKQFQTIQAKFQPKRTDDLRPELLSLIGEVFEFQYMWLMDNEDPFPNVWALTTKDDRFTYWTPEFDLEIVQ